MSRRAPGAPAADEAGQASVELVALVPLLVLVAFAAAQLLATGAAASQADHAAEAAAIALLQGGDPAAAARAAVPGWSRARVALEIEGRHVRVRLRPPAAFPALGGMLERTAEADAGPAP